MYLGIKNIDKNNENKYSSLTYEERLKLKRKIIQDGVNFSQNFSNSNFINFQNLKKQIEQSEMEFSKLKRMLKCASFPLMKKKELLDLAKSKQFNLPMSLFQEPEVKFYKTVIIPYVMKEMEIKELKKGIFNSYQNHVIYKDVFELWRAELVSINKEIIFETHIKTKHKNLQENKERDIERKEEINKGKIEKMKRRIQIHKSKIEDPKQIEINNPIKEESKLLSQKIEEKKINFDNWL